MLNITRFVTYSSRLLENALVAIRQLNVNQQILGLFTKNERITNEIRQECGGGGSSVELQIKEVIVALLADCLPLQAIPNLAHYLGSDPALSPQLQGLPVPPHPRSTVCERRTYPTTTRLLKCVTTELKLTSNKSQYDFKREHDVAVNCWGRRDKRLREAQVSGGIGKLAAVHIWPAGSHQSQNRTPAIPACPPGRVCLSLPLRKTAEDLLKNLTDRLQVFECCRIMFDSARPFRNTSGRCTKRINRFVPANVPNEDLPSRTPVRYLKQHMSVYHDSEYDLEEHLYLTRFKCLAPAFL
ncbi:hypothetical protein pipiens_000654, partial [Culex pipiens pipiens]